MLARYRIVRGRRPPDEPAPAGMRIDIRKHTRHVLAPSPALVDALLVDPGDATRARAFRTGYLALLQQRFRTDRAPFDTLARLARSSDVYLGCNCPTKRQPDVSRCHSVLALRFMRQRYPDLHVQPPAGRSMQR
jgi:hypothetical protein